MYADLDGWFSEWDLIMSKSLTEESVLRKMLLADLHYAKLWVVCVALRGASWDRSEPIPSICKTGLADSVADIAFSYLSNSALRTT